MSVTSVGKMWSVARSNIAASDNFRRFTRTHTVGYSVLATAGTTPTEVETSGLIPTVSSVDPDYPLMRCLSVDVNQISPIYFHALATYQGEVSAGGLHPIYEPPELHETDIEFEEEVEQDAYGNVLANANGELITGATAIFTDTVLTIRKNVLYFNSYARRQYRRATNSDWYYGWPPGTARFTRLESTPVGSGAGMYYTIDAQVQFREPINTTPDKAWYRRFRHEGFYERIGDVTVTLSGGDGSGAIANGIFDRSGKLASFQVINGGSGYTSAPTVSISATDGSGAAGTAIVEDGTVTRIDVTNQGSGYKTKLVRALDDRGQPMTSPVLLDIQGRRLYDTSQALWMERPMFRPLPFNALGLLV